jgi:hypothetical protein
MRIKWDYEKCKEAISKMVYLNDLQGTSVLGVIKRNGWYDELTKPLIRKKRSHWLKEDIAKIAKNYKHKVDFMKDYNGAYLYACRHGWWIEISSHMVSKTSWRKGKSDWNKNITHELAKQYETKSEFHDGKKIGSFKTNYKAKYAYEVARVNGWLEDICSHMKQNINDRPRYIYVALWEDQKLCYVGLTQHIKDRFSDHRNNPKSAVWRTTKIYGDPEFKILTDEPVDVSIAAQCEEEWKSKYESMGYTSVNVAKTGSLGSYSRIWDYESVKAEAAKYERRTDFHLNGGGAVEVAKKNGWLEDICSHMPIIRGRWDIFENVQSEALKYRTRNDFKHANRSAHCGALKHKWMDILYPKENLKMGDTGYWLVKDNVHKVALLYKTKSEFETKYKGAYKSAHRNKWIDDVCSHMDVLVGRWKTIEDIKIEAKKYKSKGEFIKNVPGAYLVARNNGWLNEVFLCYPKISSRWCQFDDVNNEAKKYKSRTEFYKFNGSAYHAAINNGWLEDVCSHMVSDKQLPGYWNNKKNVIDVALKCENKTEFNKKHKGAYNSARRNGWLDELFTQQ